MNVSCDSWYAGLAVMAALEIIEWPLAIMMMLGHKIAHRVHNQALRDFAEGIEAERDTRLNEVGSRERKVRIALAS